MRDKVEKVTAIGCERVDASATLGAHHVEEGFDQRGVAGGHWGTGSASQKAANRLIRQTVIGDDLLDRVSDRDDAPAIDREPNGSRDHQNPKTQCNPRSPAHRFSVPCHAARPLPCLWRNWWPSCKSCWRGAGSACNRKP